MTSSYVGNKVEKLTIFAFKQTYVILTVLIQQFRPFSMLTENIGHWHFENSYTQIVVPNFG